VESAGRTNETRNSAVNDLQILSSRGGNSVVRSVRTGAALFGSGVVVGIVVAAVFHALIITIVVGGAFIIVLGALLRLFFGRGRSRNRY
jgi:hypothetical protein